MRQIDGPIQEGSGSKQTLASTRAGNIGQFHIYTVELLLQAFQIMTPTLPSRLLCCQGDKSGRQKKQIILNSKQDEKSMSYKVLEEDKMGSVQIRKKKRIHHITELTENYHYFCF